MVSSTLMVDKRQTVDSGRVSWHERPSVLVIFAVPVNAPSLVLQISHTRTYTYNTYAVQSALIK